MTIETWLLFASISLAATLSPGPAVLLVTTHSLQYGPRRSIRTILGNITGLFLMSLFAVIGLSTLLLYSALAFSVFKTIGAAYLIWLGIRLWRRGMAAANPHDAGRVQSDAGLYRQGLLIALTNPKAIAFTTALFPQFITTGKPLSAQFLILAGTLMFLSFTCLLGYALASHRLNRHTGPMLSGKLTGKIFGGVFIASGAALAATGSR